MLLLEHRNSRAALALLLCGLGQIVAMLGCGEAAQPSSSAHAAKERAIVVFAPNPPLAWLVRELGGDRVELLTPWSASSGDPADWKPSDAEVRLLQGADCIVLNGADYEPWATTAALPRSVLLDSTASLASELIKQDDGTHSHGPRGAHAHTGFASTTWLSPSMFSAQAQRIAARLTKLLPSSAPNIAAQLARVEARVRALDEEQKALAVQAPVWLASHPVYQYLGASSGATIDAMHWEPNELPSDAQWNVFTAMRATHAAAWLPMLWEGEPDALVRARLKSLGVTVVVYPPLGSGESDFLASCAESAARLRAAVAESTAQTK
ncbi:MAG: zinc ABC transporter substrate-binding protein [Phycisphaerales bacterium]|nr:zinc ABC transporter substrate-binding protein [Phycisphaerales bacterium]